MAGREQTDGRKDGLSHATPRPPASVASPAPPAPGWPLKKDIAARGRIAGRNINARCIFVKLRLGIKKKERPCFSIKIPTTLLVVTCERLLGTFSLSNDQLGGHVT